MVIIVMVTVAGTLMLFNLPIAFATGLATVVGIIYTDKFTLDIFAQKMVSSLDTFTFVAIPLFILTGRLMNLGGITQDLLRFANALVGFMRGGLSYVNIVGSMFFAGITGSAASDTASIGGIMIPAMYQKNYRKDLTVAVTATASVIGIIIPPSIPMVIYGASASVSIGKLFLAGFIPGLLIGLSLMGVSYIYGRKHHYRAEGKFNAKEIGVSFFKSVPALMTIVIMLGGIATGLFTPTEAAGIAVLYSLILGFFYYGELKLGDLPKILLEVAETTAIVTFMISTATCLGFVLAVEHVPLLLSKFILSISTNKILILISINLLLLFVGMWMDLAPALVIFTPILLPTAVMLGIDPVQFGLIMIVNLGIGLVTPPVGICLFLACAIGKISIAYVAKTLFPFILAMVAVLAIISFVPQVTLFLPNFFMPSL
jgi:C4-dicarboxylate transporter DctM subunit